MDLEALRCRTSGTIATPLSSGGNEERSTMTLQLPRCESGADSTAEQRRERPRHPYCCTERAARGRPDGWAVYDGPGACDSRIDFAAGDGVENLDLQPHGADEGIIKICF